MEGELAFSHGVTWWRGEVVAVLEVEPTSNGWTAHLSAEHGGFAVAIDDETKSMLDARIVELEARQ